MRGMGNLGDQYGVKFDEILYEKPFYVKVKNNDRDEYTHLLNLKITLHAQSTTT
jgi:hypothetical protein